MTTTFAIISDMYSDRRYAYEPEFVYDPSKTLLDNILFYFNKPEAELHKLKETKAHDGTVEEAFSIKGVLGKETRFYIRKRNGEFLFGWLLDGCMQQRSWQYIIRDIMGHYSSGFF